MPRAKQFTLRLKDKPGMLGEVASELGSKKVNIRGLCAATQGGAGTVWLVVDKAAAARKIFTANDWLASEDDVMEVTLSDNPGSLGRFTSKLGKAGVNITFAYAGTAGSARKVNAYFGVSDLKAALKVRP
jgi:hypothetical protein